MPYLRKLPAKQGKVWVDRNKPWPMFLKTGGDIFAMHAQLGGLVVTVEPFSLQWVNKVFGIWYVNRKKP